MAHENSRNALGEPAHATWTLNWIKWVWKEEWRRGFQPIYFKSFYIYQHIMRPQFADFLKNTRLNTRAIIPIYGVKSE
ncbi:hypothetical protein GbCGDNIH4_7205 [Granulibacter bethesdensis CGDNIH4]|nr:hypothetical protein GbCGDNIH4_7205 [Granulibacter bethesdensis CGDNIH4]